MMPRRHDVCRVFQNALKRADIVVGYDLVCRRSGCGYKERRATGDEARCPTCNMALWVKPVPKPLRFHDTRSTFGTHLRERTGDIVRQKRLGHSSPAITAEIYSGVRTPYAMEMINKLHFGSTPRSGSASGIFPAEAPGPVPPTSASTASSTASTSRGAPSPTPRSWRSSACYTPAVRSPASRRTRGPRATSGSRARPRGADRGLTRCPTTIESIQNPRSASVVEERRDQPVSEIGSGGEVAAEQGEPRSRPRLGPIEADLAALVDIDRAQRGRAGSV